jgi:FixJ family two-component response regulator
MKTFKNSRVIVLDSAPPSLETLTETIQSWGFSAESFDRPEATLQRARDKGCEIVLLNVLTADIDCLNVIPQFGKDLKIVLITEHPDKDIAIRALKLGAFDLLEKPVQNELLYHSIMRALKVLENERHTKRLIEELKLSNAELLARQRRLENLDIQLLESNRALAALARAVECEKEELEGQIGLRLRNLLMPIVTGLRNDQALKKHEGQLSLLAWHVEDLTTAFSMDPGIVTRLSSAEMRIASLVKNGVSTDEIARQLHISENTVRSHRRSIRKKLKINTQHSLRNFLASRSLDRSNG